MSQLGFSRRIRKRTDPQLCSLAEDWRPLKVDRSGRILVAVAHQFVKNESANVMVDTPVKSQRMNHPGSALWRDRHRMVSIPVRRKRDAIVRNEFRQCRDRNRDLDKIEVEQRAVRARMPNFHLMCARVAGAERKA